MSSYIFARLVPTDYVHVALYVSLSDDLELPGADISWVDKLDPTESTPQRNLNQPQTRFVEGKEPEEEGQQDFDSLEVFGGPGRIRTYNLSRFRGV
jgi:hypothetical protein